MSGEPRSPATVEKRWTTSVSVPGSEDSGPGIAADVVGHGTSTVHGAFTKPIIDAMCAGVDRPIILPISNPTSRIEAMPSDVIPWSDGKALVATGIPLDPVPYKGSTTRSARPTTRCSTPASPWARSSPEPST